MGQRRVHSSLDLGFTVLVTDKSKGIGSQKVLLTELVYMK
jgi:hypothetical protein